MTKPTSSVGLSRRVAAAQSEILRIATAIVPHATVVSVPTREQLSCMIAVDTDDQKKRINGDEALLQEMIQAAALAGRKPDFLSAESQESVDRRWNGNWNALWR